MLFFDGTTCLDNLTCLLVKNLSYCIYSYYSSLKHKICTILFVSAKKSILYFIIILIVLKFFNYFSFFAYNNYHLPSFFKVNKFKEIIKIYFA